MLRYLTRRIATQKKLESWTWRKCAACAYLVAMVLWVVVLFVVIPMVVYK